MRLKAERSGFMVTAILVVAAGMAAFGIAYPGWADFPLIVFYEPIVAAAIFVLVFGISLVSRRLGILAAAICATPMFILVGAPPAGIAGAVAFFSMTFVVGGIGTSGGWR
jgi:hypothetical protein